MKPFRVVFSDGGVTAMSAEQFNVTDTGALVFSDADGAVCAFASRVWSSVIGEDESESYVPPVLPVHVPPTTNKPVPRAV